MLGSRPNRGAAGRYTAAGRWAAPLFGPRVTQRHKGQALGVRFLHWLLARSGNSASNQVAFLHIATSSNITSNYTDIDHPATNNRPDALILVTPNWSPGGRGDVYNDHSTGVWYHQGKWSIFNQDKIAMPVGAAFNVVVI